MSDIAVMRIELFTSTSAGTAVPTSALVYLDEVEVVSGGGGEGGMIEDWESYGDIAEITSANWGINATGGAVNALAFSINRWSRIVPLPSPLRLK